MKKFLHSPPPSISLLPQLSRSMMRHHQEQSTQVQRSEKEELQRLRKVASSIAKEVKHFWDSVRKVTISQLVCHILLYMLYTGNQNKGSSLISHFFNKNLLSTWITSLFMYMLIRVNKIMVYVL